MVGGSIPLVGFMNITFTNLYERPKSHSWIIGHLYFEKYEDPKDIAISGLFDEWQMFSQIEDWDDTTSHSIIFTMDRRFVT